MKFGQIDLDFSSIWMAGSGVHPRLGLTLRLVSCFFGARARSSWERTVECDCLVDMLRQNIWAQISKGVVDPPPFGLPIFTKPKTLLIPGCLLEGDRHAV